MASSESSLRYLADSAMAAAKATGAASAASAASAARAAPLPFEASMAWLEKKASRFPHNWQARFFVVRRDKRLKIIRLDASHVNRECRWQAFVAVERWYAMVWDGDNA